MLCPACQRGGQPNVPATLRFAIGAGQQTTSNASRYRGIYKLTETGNLLILNRFPVHFRPEHGSWVTTIRVHLRLLAFHSLIAGLRPLVIAARHRCIAMSYI
jgi:hypothetical protein